MGKGGTGRGRENIDLRAYMLKLTRSVAWSFLDPLDTPALRAPNNS